LGINISAPGKDIHSDRVKRVKPLTHLKIKTTSAPDTNEAKSYNSQQITRNRVDEINEFCISLPSLYATYDSFKGP
jgi:hypothetical protein